MLPPHPQTTSFIYTPPPSLTHRTRSSFIILHLPHSFIGHLIHSPHLCSTSSSHTWATSFIYLHCTCCIHSFLYLFHSYTTFFIHYQATSLFLQALPPSFIHDPHTSFIHRLSLSFTFIHVAPSSLIHAPPPLFLHRLFSLVISLPTPIYHR